MQNHPQNVTQPLPGLAPLVCGDWRLFFDLIVNKDPNYWYALTKWIKLPSAFKAIVRSAVIIAACEGAATHVVPRTNKCR